MVQEDEPFRLPVLFATREIQATSSTGRQELLLEVGMPVESRDDEWLCMWNLYATVPRQQLVAKGASQGADPLQSVLRALQVLRATLAQLSEDNGAELVWRGNAYGGIPDLGPTPA